MIRKILVPTDLSASSKAAIRFAIQLEKQSGSRLVFYHCIPGLRPTSWSAARYAAYLDDQSATAEKTLHKMVKDAYRSAGIKVEKITYVIKSANDVQRAIIREAKIQRVDAIAMSSRGAGRLRRIVGTNTSAIIQKSPVPVFVVPKDYKRKPVKRILYSSDLNRLGPELKKVRKVADKLKARIVVYHYDYLADVKEARKKFEKSVKRYRIPGVTFNLQKHYIERSLAKHLTRDIEASKASLAVLFSQQKRGWFDRLFLGSKSIDVAFDTTIPLLIFPKE